MQTEGIKYAGSKLKLLPHIIDMVKGLGAGTVLDGFSGTTRVSQAFAQLGWAVTSNDIAVWSEVFATCYLKAPRPDSFYAPLIAELNALDGKEGWFTANYGGADDEAKKPFRRTNAMKIDAIRERILCVIIVYEPFREVLHICEFCIAYDSSVRKKYQRSVLQTFVGSFIHLMAEKPQLGGEVLLFHKAPLA